MTHLFLTGYRGTGKSTIARHLADRLALPAADLDVEIERAAGRAVREIFAAEGEAGFRRRESDALGRLVARPCHVIALGGGAILAEKNRRWIAGTGRCCWLRAAPETIARRLRNDPHSASLRPALTSLDAREEIGDLLRQRTPLYAEVAQFAVDTDDAPLEQIVERIARWWIDASS